jgi:hypothetical protein
MNDKWTVNHTWTQPYLPTSYNPFYERSILKNELTTQEELERLEEIDDQVTLMRSYPDAEKILKKIQKNS